MAASCAAHTTIVVPFSLSASISPMQAITLSLVWNFAIGQITSDAWAIKTFEDV